MSPLAERLSETVERLGADPRRFTTAGDRVSLDGRSFSSVGGEYPDWLLEAVVLRSLEPSHVLFLCVANSARSQLAEGIARSLAPTGVRVSSAGSEPSEIRPEAVRALSEIGVDARGQRAKGMDEVERPVEAVITLCAEEACPAWLGRAVRLHWPLADPASVEETARLDAFRAARDELQRRLRVLFA